MCHLSAKFKIPALVIHTVRSCTPHGAIKQLFLLRDSLAFVMSCIVISVVFVFVFVFVVVSPVQDTTPRPPSRCFEWALKVVSNYGKEISKGFSKVGR